MADWSDLVAHVKRNYKVANEMGDSLGLLFGMPGGRTQMVVLSHQRLMGGTEHWVRISSPIGDMNEKLLPKLVLEAGKKVCGGIGSSGDFVTYQHGFPLENFDVNEFERPLILVTSTADELEKNIFGGDRF